MLKKIGNYIGAICGVYISPVIKSKTIYGDKNIDNLAISVDITNNDNKKELYIKDEIKRINISDIKNWTPRRNIDGYRLFEGREEARNFGSKTYGEWSGKLICTYKKKEIDNELNPYKVLRYYFGNLYVSLNPYLRFGRHRSIANRLDEMIENLDIAFEDVPELNENIITFRCVRLHGEFMYYYQSLQEGDIINDKAYMSTSLILDIATSYGWSFSDDNALLVIKIPKGEKCIFIDEVNRYLEYEMLINKNRSLKVEKILVKNDKQVVVLCELQSEL